MICVDHIQEELAFMYEMLGLYEDALVQYDELDALFTQFILNRAAGGRWFWKKFLYKCFLCSSLYSRISVTVILLKF